MLTEGSMMIRRCTDLDLAEMYSIINGAAQAYKGVIPDDRWHEPYMPLEVRVHGVERQVEPSEIT